MPRPASSRGRTPSSGAPSQRSRPSSGATKPQTQLNKVVLPAPLGPITPTTSPARADIDTPSSAVSPPKRTVKPSTSRAAAIAPPSAVAEPSFPSN